MTVGAGRPSAAAALHGKLGLVSRPDGARQVTFRGRPLYRFTQDPSPGVVTGNGFADSFGGRSHLTRRDAERRCPDERELERHGRINRVSLPLTGRESARDPRGGGRRRLRARRKPGKEQSCTPTGDEDAIA